MSETCIIIIIFRTHNARFFPLYDNKYWQTINIDITKQNYFVFLEHNTNVLHAKEQPGLLLFYVIRKKIIWIRTTWRWINDDRIQTDEFYAEVIFLKHASITLFYLSEQIQGYLDLAVDVGCGSGQGSELLAPHFLTVVGTDVSPAQLEIASAKEHAPNVCYR